MAWDMRPHSQAELDAGSPAENVTIVRGYETIGCILLKEF